MKFEVILVLFGLYQTHGRSHLLTRDALCSDVKSGTLVLKDDVDSCTSYVACIGQIALRFKCFRDSVYSNGSAVCLSCDDGGEDYYDQYGIKTTKKKFTYKQTKRPKSTPKKYERTTRPPYYTKVTEPDTTGKNSLFKNA
jgi:hypothetical protein